MSTPTHISEDLYFCFSSEMLGKRQDLVVEGLSKKIQRAFDKTDPYISRGFFVTVYHGLKEPEYHFFKKFNDALETYLA